jgi:iron complex outermembrane receptor protein
MKDYKTHCHSHTKGLLLSVITLFCYGGWSEVTAQPDTFPISEHYFFDEVPVVLSATRLSQPLSDIPAAITIIDKQMIRASGAMEIPDLLRLVPGFHVANHNSAEFAASYHGNSNDFALDMQVLIDGRSVYDPGFGGITWSDLPLAIEDINRIEVIRGPNAAAYGSNSFAGVINIITEYPSEQQGNMVKLIAGGEDATQVIMRHAGSQGAFDYRITVSRDENENLPEIRDRSMANWASFRGDYQIDADNQLLLEAGYSDTILEEGMPGITIPPPRNTDHLYHFQQIRWTHTIAPENELSLQFYHNYQEIEDFTEFSYTVPVLGTLMLTYDIGFETHRYDLELQHSFRPRDDLRVVWGLGARHDRMNSFGLLDDHNDIIRNQIRAFINTEWHPKDDINLNLGAMYEKFEGYDGLFSPRLAVNYHLASNHTIRASLSRAYRMPSIWEAHADFQIHGLPAPFEEHLHYATPGMDPERIDAFEIGYLGIFPDSNVTFDVRLFREKLEPLISRRRDMSIFPPPAEINVGAIRIFNSGYLEIDGIEFQLDYRPTERTIFHLGYSITTTKGEEVRDILPSGAHDQPPRVLDDVVSDHTLGFLAGHEFRNGLQLSTSVYYIDEVEWKSDGDLIPGYTRWDMRLAKKFKFPSADAEVSLVVQNIDGRHTEFMEDPWYKTETEAYLQFALQFH